MAIFWGFLVAGHKFLSQNSSVWELEIEDIQISGDLAFVRGKGSESVTEKESGEIEKIDSKEILILRRGSDGKWKAVIEIWNSNVDDDDDEHSEG